MARSPHRNRSHSRRTDVAMPPVPDGNGVRQPGSAVLAFDSGCGPCSELARRIEDSANGRLVVKSLDDPEVLGFRKAAFGDPPPWRPTLIDVGGAEAKAYLGAALIWKLVARVGLGDALRIGRDYLRIRKDRKITNGEVAFGVGMSRRQFVSAIPLAGVAVGAFGLGALAKPGHNNRAPDTPPQVVRSSAVGSKLKEKARTAISHRRAADGRGLSDDAFDWDEAIEFEYDNGHRVVAAPLADHDSKNAFGIVAIDGETEDANPLMVELEKIPVGVRITYADLERLPLVSVELKEDGSHEKIRHDHPAMGQEVLTAGFSPPIAHPYGHNSGYWSCVGWCLDWATGTSVGWLCGIAIGGCMAGAYPSCVVALGCAAGSATFCLVHC